MVEPQNYQNSFEELHRLQFQQLESIQGWDKFAAEMIGESFGEILKLIFDLKDKSATAIEYLMKVANSFQEKGNGEYFAQFKSGYDSFLQDLILKCPVTNKPYRVTQETMNVLEEIIQTLLEGLGDKNNNILSNFIDENIYIQYKSKSENKIEQANLLHEYAETFKGILSNILLRVIKQPKDYDVTIKNIPRILNKIKTNDLKQIELSLFDLIKASIYFEEESQFKIVFQKLQKSNKFINVQNNLTTNQNAIIAIIILENNQNQKIFAEIKFIWGHSHQYSEFYHFFEKIQRCNTFIDLVTELQLNNTDIVHQTDFDNNTIGQKLQHFIQNSTIQDIQNEEFLKHEQEQERVNQESLKKIENFKEMLVEPLNDNTIIKLLSFQKEKFDYIKQLLDQNKRLRTQQANKILEQVSSENNFEAKLFFFNYQLDYKEIVAPPTEFNFKKILAELQKQFSGQIELEELLEFLEEQENDLKHYKDFIEYVVEISSKNQDLALNFCNMVSKIEPIFLITLYKLDIMDSYIRFKVTFENFEEYKSLFAINSFLENNFEQLNFQNLPIDLKRIKYFQETHTNIIGQIDKQCTINDLLEIQYGLSFEVIFNEIKRKYQNKENFAQNMIRVIFEFMKRKSSIQEIINTILLFFKDCKFLPSTLLYMIFENVSTEFRSLLLIFFSQYMPIPFVTPPLIDKENYFKIYPELYYSIQKAYSVLSFCLCSSQNNYPIGKSEILNKLFGRQFQTIEKCEENIIQNIIKSGFIEIQTDAHYAQPQYMMIADAHGVIDIQILRKIYSLFNSFIIHIFADDCQEQLTKEIQFIKKINIDAFITIFIHSNNVRKTDIEPTFDESSNIMRYEVKHLRDANKDYQSLIIKSFWARFNTIYQYQSSYDGNFQSKQEFKLQFLEVSKLFDVNITNEMVSHEAISEFLQIFVQFKDNYKSQEFLSLSELFIQQCKTIQKLKNIDLDLSNDERQKLNDDLIILQDEFQNRAPTQIVECFYRFINQNNFLPALIDLSNRIKGFVSQQLEYFENKRNDVVQQIKKATLEEEKQQYQEEKILIQYEINNRNFSYELLVRELYCLKKFLNSLSDDTDYFKSLVSQLVASGQPFEIIDGDNLHYISNVYEQIFKQNDIANNTTLVVSIIGPQSSGKSTLLNFLFGTQFASSSGRCTKGMYGAVMKINNHPKYDQLLILDTEGIQSAERQDPLFDKKIVLYCLCISQVVLICNRGDMNIGMKEIIRLTVSLLQEIKEAKIKDPQIFIILNALTDINRSKLWEQLQALDIAMNFKVEMLPFAFDREELLNGKTINLPSKGFAKICQELALKIMGVQEEENMTSEKISLIDWTVRADRLWSVIDTSKELMQYDNLNQKDDDKKIKDHIDEIMKGIKDKKESQAHEINNLFIEIKKNYENTSSINFDEFQKDIKQIIKSQYNSLIKKKHIQEFKKYCADRNIATELTKKRKKLLKEQLQTIFEDWNNIMHKSFLEFKKEKSYYGENFINEQINILLTEKEQYTKQEAAYEFETLWLKKRDDMLKNLQEKSEKENFDRTQVYYKSKTNQTYSDAIVQSKMKEYFDHLNENILEQHLRSGSEPKILYFVGKERLPVISQILQQQKENSDKLYFKLKPIFGGTEAITFIYRNQLQIVFKKETIKKKIVDIYQRNRQTAFYFFRKQDSVNEYEFIKQIKNVIIEISKELTKYNILLQQKFTDEILDYFTDMKTKYNCEYPDEIDRYNKNDSDRYNKNDSDRYNKNDSDRYNNNNDNENYINTNSHANNSNEFYRNNQNYGNSNIYSNQSQPVNDWQNHKAHNIDTFQFVQKGYNDFYNFVDRLVNGIENFVEINDILLLDRIQPSCNYLKNIPSIKRHRNFLLNLPTNVDIIKIGQQDIMQVLAKNCEKQLEKLLKWYTNPTEPLFNIFQDNINEGQKFFLEQINFEQITLDLQNIVFYSFLKDTNLKIEKGTKKNYLKDKIIFFRTETDLSLKFKELIRFRELNNDLISSVVFGVQALISTINCELEAVRYQFSLTSIQLLNLFTLISIWVFYHEIEKIKVQEPLLIFDSTRQKFEKFFISMLINDEENSDKQLALIIVDDIVKNIKKNSTVTVQDQFAQTLHDNKQYFTAHDAMKSFDTRKDDEAKLLHYILNPREALKDEFQLQWHNYCYKGGDQNNTFFAQEYKILVNDMFDDVISIFQELKLNLQQSKNLDLSINIFTITKQIGKANENELAQVTYKIAYQQAAAIFVINFLSGNWDSTNAIQIENIGEIKLLKPSQKNDKKIQKPEIYQTFERQLKNQKIVSLRIFVEEVLCLLKSNHQIISQDILSEAELDSSGLKKKFEDLYIGCSVHCPLCNRKCDIDHSDSNQDEIQHSCGTGHQLRAFCGNKMQGSNAASLKTCNDLNDNDQISYHEKVMTWKDYKNLKVEWSFPKSDPNNVMNKLNKEKYNKIWIQIGQQICDYYSAKGNVMKFIEPGEMPMPLIHYMFLLDDSGSMSGQPWQQLEAAVLQFLQQLCQSETYKKHFKISIGIFNSSVREICCEIELNNQLPAGFAFKSGGTNFDEPFKLLKRWISESVNRYGQFNVAFMSDGGSSYDKQHLIDIKNITGLGEKLRFCSIAFGAMNASDKERMAGIAQFFNGKLEAALNTPDLVRSFIEVLNVD